jgi:hypothetical protein
MSQARRPSFNSIEYFNMICDDCKTAFFSPLSWAQLRKGVSSNLLQWAAKSSQVSGFCTICSSVFESVQNALVSRLRQSANYGDGITSTDGDVSCVQQWPELPVQVEERLGRLSFLVGPLHDANFLLSDGTIISIDVDAWFFVLSPRQGT